MSFFKSLFFASAKKHKMLITNTLTNGTLLASGDFVVQLIERKYHKKDESQLPSIDWKRTGRFFITGLCFGPVLHGWYTLLDKRFPLLVARTVAAKVFLDQTIAGPVAITYFFLATGYLEGKKFEESKSELKQKFLVTYVADWAIWPAAQSFNFFIVPPKFRVICVSTITFFYSICLSFIKNTGSQGNKFIERIDKLFGF